MGTSSVVGQPESWFDADLAGTTSAPLGSTYQVNLVGSNANAGQLTLRIAGLQAGGQSGVLASASYETPGSFPSPDSWSCTFPNGGSCTGTFQVQAFDGTHLIGNFVIQFYAPSSADQAQNASLTSGSFNVTLH